MKQNRYMGDFEILLEEIIFKPKCTPCTLSKFLGLISEKNDVVNLSTAACLWRTVLAYLLTAFFEDKKI